MMTPHLCLNNLMLAFGALVFVFCCILALTGSSNWRKKARFIKKQEREQRAMERYRYACQVAAKWSYIIKPQEVCLISIINITADAGMEDLSTREAREFMKSMWQWRQDWWAVFVELILFRNGDPYNPYRRRGDILRGIEANWYKIELPERSRA